MTDWACAPKASRTTTVTVLIWSASGGNPVSTTPGCRGTTSIKRSLVVIGTARMPGSLDVIRKGPVPPPIVNVFFTPA